MFLKNPTAPNKFWDCICGWILGSKQLLRGCLEHHGLSFHSYPICPNPYPFIMLHGGESQEIWHQQNWPASAPSACSTSAKLRFCSDVLDPSLAQDPVPKERKKTGGSSYLNNYLVTIVRSHLYIYILCIHIYIYCIYIYLYSYIYVIYMYICYIYICYIYIYI